MRLSELREYTRLKSDELYHEIAIRNIEELKAEKISLYSSPPFDAIPGSGNVPNRTEQLALLCVELGKTFDAEIKEHRAALETVRARIKAIDDFIESVPDKEARAMLRRHVKQRASFNQIAREFFVSRNSVARKIRRACK